MKDLIVPWLMLICVTLSDFGVVTQIVSGIIVMTITIILFIQGQKDRRERKRKQAKKKAKKKLKK